MLAMTATLAGWLLACFPGAIYPILAWGYLRGTQERRARAVALAQRAEKSYQRNYLGTGAGETLDQVAALKRLPYAYPLVLTFLVATGFAAVSLVRAGIDLGLYEKWVDLIKKVSINAIAGFWGAFLWGTYDSLSRFRSRSWTPNAIHFTWLRLLVGPALGTLAALPFAASYSPLVAFALGSFPTDALRRWAQSLAADKLKFAADMQMPIRPPWSTIQGLTTEIVERLAEADISSPCHLACAEPVGLHSKTNIEWRTILDMIDQALLAVYLEEKAANLRPLGVRGAIEVAVLWPRLSAGGPVNVQALQTVEAMRAALALDSPAPVLNLIQNLYEDAQVNLIWELWFKD